MCGLCFPPFSFDSSSLRTLPGLRSLRGLTTFVSALWHDTWGSATILGHSSHDSGCFSGAPHMSRSNEACWVGPHTTRCAACLTKLCDDEQKKQRVGDTWHFVGCLLVLTFLSRIRSRSILVRCVRKSSMR